MRLKPLAAAFGIAFATLSSAALRAQATSPLHLIPIPRELRPGATLPLTNGLRINCAQPCNADDAFAIADLTAALAERHIPISDSLSAPHILITRFNTPLGRSVYHDALPASAAPSTGMDPQMAAEGYVILPDPNGSHQAGLALTAETSAGIFYALQTVKQLIVGDGATATLNTATIHDWPAMKYRGLHDDLSRGPVDTLAFQEHLIHTLAAYKINLYSPYFENTQQYASNPLAAPPQGSLSAADARALAAYAAQFHITVVPEQEAFGHLRKMLVWETYADLAETPHGAVLSPGQPGSLPLIKQMFTELADLYPGPFLHVGGDETIDLGIGRTKPDVDARGLAPVYLDYLQHIVTTLEPLHRKILFWGDVAQDAPDLLKALPPSTKDQLIAVAWGYTPKPKGFDAELKPYINAGIQTWVAPSINNYRQVWPNQQLALDDIQEFTRDGQRFGATGQLNTLWDDDGESLANMNWYGILFGAAAAWQPGESSIPAFQQSFAQVFHGDSLGLLNQAQAELTAAMTLLHETHPISNTEGTDGLFWVDPWSKDGQLMADKMRPINSAIRLHAEHALILIDQARQTEPNLRELDALSAMDFGARRIDFLGLKFQLANEMADGYSRAQTTALLPPPARGEPRPKPSVSALLSDINGVNGRLQDIIDTYSQLRDMYQQQWNLTYRPTGLRPILEHYDYTIALWYSRVDKVRSAQRQWSEIKTLPAAADLGIPAPAALTHPQASRL
jgi:hexosaminidase